MATWCSAHFQWRHCITEQKKTENFPIFVATGLRHLAGLTYTAADQWSFRKTGTPGTLTSQLEIGVWVQAVGDASARVPENFCDFIYKILQSSAFFRRKMIRKAVHNEFLNTLTIGTPFPCVQAAFRQRKRRSHAFPSKWPLPQIQHAGIFLRVRGVG